MFVPRSVAGSRHAAGLGALKKHVNTPLKGLRIGRLGARGLELSLHDGGQLVERGQRVVEEKGVLREFHRERHTEGAQQDQRAAVGFEGVAQVPDALQDILFAQVQMGVLDEEAGAAR